MTAGTVLLLLTAGLGAGLSGSLAGLASLFSYPALLAAGLPATAANVTNTVALVASTAGAVAGSRPELAGQGAALRRLAPGTALGGAAGAALLLLTPPGVFERVVPVLVALAGVVLLVQPRLRAAAQRRGALRTGRAGPPGAPVTLGVAAVAVYGGYFGAAAGVLMLALLLVGTPAGLLRANAYKNVLLGVANAVAAVGFAVAGPVHWAAVPPLAVGVFAGARLGPVVARRLPPDALRIGIGVAALGLAGALAAGVL